MVAGLIDLLLTKSAVIWRSSLTTVPSASRVVAWSECLYIGMSWDLICQADYDVFPLQSLHLPDDDRIKTRSFAVWRAERFNGVLFPPRYCTYPIYECNRSLWHIDGWSRDYLRCWPLFDRLSFVWRIIENRQDVSFSQTQQPFYISKLSGPMSCVRLKPVVGDAPVRSQF